MLLHNLADTTVTVDIGAQPSMNGNPCDLFVDGPYPAPTERLTDLTLNGWDTDGSVYPEAIEANWAGQSRSEVPYDHPRYAVASCARNSVKI